jgi:hypothetical protein
MNREVFAAPSVTSCPILDVWLCSFLCNVEHGSGSFVYLCVQLLLVLLNEPQLIQCSESCLVSLETPLFLTHTSIFCTQIFSIRTDIPWYRYSQIFNKLDFCVLTYCISMAL